MSTPICTCTRNESNVIVYRANDCPRHSNAQVPSLSRLTELRRVFEQAKDAYVTTETRDAYQAMDAAGQAYNRYLAANAAAILPAASISYDPMRENQVTWHA